MTSKELEEHKCIEDEEMSVAVPNQNFQPNYISEDENDVPPPAKKKRIKDSGDRLRVSNWQASSLVSKTVTGTWMYKEEGILFHVTLKIKKLLCDIPAPQRETTHIYTNYRIIEYAKLCFCGL